MDVEGTEKVWASLNSLKVEQLIDRPRKPSSSSADITILGRSDSSPKHDESNYIDEHQIRAPAKLSCLALRSKAWHTPIAMKNPMDTG